MPPHPKTCMVPGCSNTCRNSTKIFIKINIYLAPKWCSAAGVNFNPKKEYYCCEDHMKLQDALENYSYWKMMNVRPRLRKDYVPRFHHSNKENYCIPHQVQAADTPQKNNETMFEVHNILTEKNIPDNKTHFIQDRATQCKPATCNKATKCKPATCNKATNYRCRNIKYKNIIKPERIDEPSNLADYIMEVEPIEVEYKPSTNGSTTEIEEQERTASQLQLRSHMLNLIKNFPKMYIGVPKPYYTMIDYIASEYKIDALHIIITLYKMKQNDTFFKISHIFEISRQQLSNLFPLTIQVLANFFQNFIFMPDLKCIKENLPLVFKIRYSNVQCILDCFEIEIQKPSDPRMQSRTWSQYNSCNTAKYLVGCTPDGFINFISKGYGGRTSDKAIVEKSDLIDHLPLNATIMADRGFKAVESILSAKNIKVLRPPSVYAGTKPSKEEVLKTKVIASLRVHVERLIRRLREFNILKPHSVITHKHLGYLDEVVIIACALCNLQAKIIKDE